ncbi:MAG: HAD family hydrolase [Methanobacteriota archaeon]|nr:MAG: HAD family hydrolase [Euryarchaeota archaeon]
MSLDWLDEVDGLLIDLDGTVYEHGKPFEGVQEVIDGLLNRYNVLFLTNTDSKNKQSLMDYYYRIGLNLPEEKVYSVPEFAKKYLLENNLSAYFVVTEELEDYFHEVKKDDFTPDVVIVGDIRGRSDLQDRLNKALRCLKRGAELYVLQKGITYVSSSGLALDSGSYGMLLENASGKKLKVMGKPNKDFILDGCKKLGIEPDHACLIGDDIEADILGAKSIGAKGVLVKTGRYDPEIVESYEENGVVPDATIENFLKIVDLFPID